MKTNFKLLFLVVVNYCLGLSVFVLHSKNSFFCRKSEPSFVSNGLVSSIQSVVPVIPLPNNVFIQSTGYIKINSKTKILRPQDDGRYFYIDFIQNKLSSIFHNSSSNVEKQKTLNIANALNNNSYFAARYYMSKSNECNEIDDQYDIYFTLNKDFEEEQYGIRYDTINRIVTVEGNTKGLIYGSLTLVQLILNNFNKSTNYSSFPAAIILDKPKYKYRGMHLDVVRHFFSTDFIKKYIDILFYYKFNKFHWHLTDDQGWRIEIKKYPALTKIGSYREGTIIGRDRLQINPDIDSVPHFGFYTQDEVKDIVNYAKERNIEIIPEIEFPGHSNALLASIPTLGCGLKNYKVLTRWRQNENIVCVGKDENFKIIFDILAEIVELFPSEYIHFGGDESNISMWKKCSNCVKKMAELNVNETGLYNYSFNIINNFLRSNNKKLVIWDDEFSKDLDTSITILNWKSDKNIKNAVNNNYRVVLNSQEFLYLNYYQNKNYKTQPLAFNGFTPLKQVYSYKTHISNLLGIQANLWTEYITTEKQAEYMILPRALAVSEIAWTENEFLDYHNFISRLIIESERFKIESINFYREFLND